MSVSRETSWPFGDLRMFGYDLIMADPPWHFKLYSEAGETKSAQNHYNVMSIEEIFALPVDALATPDCLMFLWATWPMLPRAMDLLQVWDFQYVTGGAWHKRTAHGKTAFGTGYRVRSACEPFLIATLGNPKTPRTHRNLIEGLRREHSRKPEEAYAWCESYMPGARRADLFSREDRPGWDSWGDEKSKFNQGDDDGRDPQAAAGEG